MAGLADDKSVVTVLGATLLVQFQINWWFVNPVDAAVALTGAYVESVWLPKFGTRT